jgi:hypothetical protein
LTWSTWIRKAHRWLSMTFTVCVIANFVVMGRETVALWVGLFTLLPLFLLLLTGLYLFVLPYATRWRSGRRPGVGGAVLE